jgi:putative peptidoglycan lipid II flippase
MFFSTVGPASFAAGYVAGAWLQTALLLRISPRRREGQTGAIGLSRLAQMAAPALCYSGLIALNPVVSRALASTVGPGVTSAFDYALRLTGVPLALFVVPLSSMLVAELARVQTRSDARLATASVLRWATFAGMAAVAAVAFLVAAAPTLIRLAFERGAFHAASTRTAGAVLTGFAPVLVGWTVMDVIGRSLFVLGKPRPAVLTAAFTLSVNAAVSLSLPRATALTIGFGADLGFLLGAAVLMIVLRRSAHDSGVAA